MNHKSNDINVDQTNRYWLILLISAGLYLLFSDFLRDYFLL